MADKDFKTIEEQLEILRKNNVFSKSATFQNIIDIYHFDHLATYCILKK